ncbi:hypothetical protein PRIPAC_93319 [Pristionchus pacificus]|uniref:Uncharacterized protein n=1 Tax=Pristionchus pacificus TaxID=54126 RepID=A0A2A6BIB2_PRIPA|nr:hypothetical protein PRIPAC_93319 [Pristionchus pacificus]|eukprot:PDM65665.1 hypothetical protein PRIPAC_45579 [Pristionchus pacificus]
MSPLAFAAENCNLWLLKDRQLQDVSGKITVKFTEISKLSDKKKVFSPEFEVAGMKWKLCFFVVRGYFGAYPVLAAPESSIVHLYVSGPNALRRTKITMFNNAGTARVLDFDNTCFIAGDDKFTFDTYESVANEIERVLLYVENLLWPAE